MPDGVNAESPEHFAPLLPYTPQPFDGQRIKERFDLTQLHGHEPIRLLDVAGDLGEKLVGGHAFLYSKSNDRQQYQLATVA